MLTLICAIFLVYANGVAPCLAEVLITQPDWSEAAQIPIAGRANPYGFEAHELKDRIRSGKLHALQYPVTVTGTLVPYRPFQNFFKLDESSPFKTFLRMIFENASGFHSEDQVFEWLGLHEYPDEEGSGVYGVPFPNHERPENRMGVTWIERGGAVGFTFSCVTCHAGNLFGKKIIGLTNRFPRANLFILSGKKASEKMPADFFQYLSSASHAEKALYKQMQKNIRSADGRPPLVLGLDTSLAQVALSLARRAQDEFATRTEWHAKFPRPESLAHEVADSKPAVWWNVKYKNRFLADGAVVSGNPILTNFLWNELGRGTSLVQLDRWFEESSNVIEDLTTAVFSSEAPRYADFFPPEQIQIVKAKEGEKIFLKSCARCHGVYQKAWSLPDSAHLPLARQLETDEVRYPEKTRVVDVGTDPNRYLGMRSLERVLNPLRLSKKYGILVKAQKGYVPPPLVGIWARWPYFHNNSIPSLCALMTRYKDRPKTYFAGEAKDPERDFDQECNGYPLGGRVPEVWKRNREAFYDATRVGLSNKGHDEGIFLRAGKELLTSDEKMSLIEFLKTL